MFFLLLTQQVAMSHAVTHLTPAALASAAGEERVGGKDLKAHACELCAAAQYASAIPGDDYRLQPPEPIVLVHVEARERAALAALRLAFHSRAPPSL